MHSAVFRQWLLVSILLLLSVTLPASPIQNPVSVDWAGEWLTLRSENFSVHFVDGQQDWAERVVHEGEKTHQRLSQRLQWQPQDPVQIVLADNMDSANGWATTFPYNQNRLYLATPDDLGELDNFQDWLTQLLTHEYTHVLHLDQARGTPAAARHWLGRFSLLFPHQFQPLFMIEGLAVREESDVEQQSGRLYSSYYAMQMAEEVRSGIKSLSEVAINNQRWPLNDAYLYGAYFYAFLEETRGVVAVQQFIENYSDNLIPFWLNPTARQVLSNDFPGLWVEFQQWLAHRFVVKLDTRPAQAITHHGLFSYPPVVQGNTVWRLYDDGHGLRHLVRYGANGEQLERIPVRHPGLFDVSPDGQIIMASPRVRKQNRRWHDLYRYRGQRWQRLTHQERYREARWRADGSLVARRQSGGLSILDLLNGEGDFLRTLWQGDHDETLGRFVVTDDDAIIAALHQEGEGWQLAKLNQHAGEKSGEKIEEKRRDWHVLTTTAALHGQPSLTSEGNRLLYVSDQGGRYNIYALDISATGSSQAGQVARLTDTATGAFNPIQTADGALWYEAYGPEGYNLYRQSALIDYPLYPSRPVHDVVEKPGATTTLRDAQVTAYRPWSTLKPRWWLPLVQIEEGTTVAGLTTGGQDALGRHIYELALGVDSRSESPLGVLRYQRDNRYRVQLSRELGYDYLDDRLVRIRHEDSLRLTRLNVLTAMDDYLSMHFGLFFERLSDQWRRNEIAPSDSVERLLAGVALIYDNSQRYLKGISLASGHRLAILAESNALRDSDFTGEIYTLDAHKFLHLGRSHVLALRLAMVAADEGAGLIRLGGAHDVLGSPLFGRNRYPLRGYDPNDLQARQLALASAEWRMPLVRIQKNWNVYPLGLKDVHGAVFVDTGAVRQATEPSRDEKFYTGAGAELTIELMAGYGIMVPLKLGMARGLDDTLGETRVYAEIGASF